MINLVAGSVLLAYYLWKGLDEKDQRPYAAAFFVTGLVGLVTGFQLAFTWPLPGSFNVGYGDATTLFGVVFLGTAIALWQGWSLVPVSLYAFFAASMLMVGLGLYSLRLGQEPLVAAVGFVLAGLGGVGAFPSCSGSRIIKRCAERNRGPGCYCSHLGCHLLQCAWAPMASFAKWVPATMATPAAK